MSKYKRDLKEETIPNKTTKGEQIITAATGNTDLGDVTAELTDFTAKNNALKGKYNDLGAARAAVDNAVDAQAEAEAAWDASLENLLTKGESNTKGDGMKMGTIPVPVFEPGSAPPAGTPVKVQNVHTSDGDGEADLEVAWNAIRSPRPRLYVVRMCEDPYNQANMQQVGMPSGSRFVKNGLTVGKKYWFEVAAVGSGGQQGPWSDPAPGVVT